MGDFNINLLNADTHRLTSDFLQCLYSFMFMPLINKPTRGTSSTATLIDNIYCNDVTECKFIQRIMMTDISDHILIFCIKSDCERMETELYK